MEITYDSIKSNTNKEKHGFSLGFAKELEWDTLSAKRDERHNYGEERFIGFAIMESRLYCVVFVDRGNQRRVISLRKANVREVKTYAKNN